LILRHQCCTPPTAGDTEVRRISERLITFRRAFGHVRGTGKAFD
jgi:hypothetical protein